MISAAEARELALEVPGVRVLRLEPQWRDASAGCPRMRLPACWGVLHRGWPLRDLQWQQEWFAADDAGEIARMPLAVWRVTAGESSILAGPIVAEVSIWAAGFIEHEAERGWHEVADAVRKAVW